MKDTCNDKNTVYSPTTRGAAEFHVAFAAEPYDFDPFHQQAVAFFCFCAIIMFMALIIAC